MFHRRCLPEQFLKENMREWEDLCDLCETRVKLYSSAIKVPQRPRYPFSELLDQLADEWLSETFSIGNLESFRDDGCAGALQKWIGQARTRNKVRIRLERDPQLLCLALNIRSCLANQSLLPTCAL